MADLPDNPSQGRSLLDDVSFFDGLLLSMMLFVISSYVIFSLEVLMAESLEKRLVEKAGQVQQGLTEGWQDEWSEWAHLLQSQEGLDKGWQEGLDEGWSSHPGLQGWSHSRQRGEFRWPEEERGRGEEENPDLLDRITLDGSIVGLDGFSFDGSRVSLDGYKVGLDGARVSLDEPRGIQTDPDRLLEGPGMESGWTDEDLAIAFYLGRHQHQDDLLQHQHQHQHQDDLHLLMTL